MMLPFFFQTKIRTSFSPKLGAFTLIELLVSISVITILSIIGLAAFSQFNRRQVVVSAARTFSSDLRLAQSKADSNEKPTTCAGTLEGYQVKIDGNNLGYKIYASCPSTSPIMIKEMAFPSPVERISGFTEVEFRTLRGSVIGGGSITLSAYNFDKTITVNWGGEIITQ